MSTKTKPQPAPVKDAEYFLLEIPDDPYAMPAHPVAGLFPLMPDDELRDLADDIKKDGLHEPILVYKGMVVDGRNRLKACQLAGREPKFEPAHIGWKHDEEKALFDLVLSYNLHRRHLTPQQRRDVIGKVLKQDPGRSNRRVAEQTKTDHKTVASVRTELEGRGEIPHVEAREDSRGRAQPSRKPRLVAAKRRASDFHGLAEEAKTLLYNHKAAFSNTQMQEMVYIGKPIQIEVARRLAKNGNSTVMEAKDSLLYEISDRPLDAIKRIVPRLTPEQRAELRQWLDTEVPEGGGR